MPKSDTAAFSFNWKSNFCQMLCSLCLSLPSTKIGFLLRKQTEQVNLLRDLINARANAIEHIYRKQLVCQYIWQDTFGKKMYSWKTRLFWKTIELIKFNTNVSSKSQSSDVEWCSFLSIDEKMVCLSTAKCWVQYRRHWGEKSTKIQKQHFYECCKSNFPPRTVCWDRSFSRKIDFYRTFSVYVAHIMPFCILTGS